MLDSDLLGQDPATVPDRPSVAADPHASGPARTHSTPTQPGPTQARPSTPPVGGPRSARLYRSRHVRWIARRPPEAIPARRPFVVGGPRPIPRYVYIPQWGLRDAPVEADGDQRTRGEILAAAVTQALHLLAGALGFAAVAHLARYILLVVNRSTPVPGWLDGFTWVLVVFAGLLSLGAYVYTTVIVTRWTIVTRADAYGRHHLRDPRPRWQIALLAATPLVNVVGAALLLHEAAVQRDDLDPVRTRRRLTRMWVAWAIVNVLAVLALVTRLVATMSGSIQTGANGLAAVVISSACSAVFAYWLAGRLTAAFGAAVEEPVPSRRWVAVA
ncbi:DUF4328 domain-containing protein [Gordonia sp. OPL2]|uniref:DUF4328 domain-containing protein n=1 Tax=Gordonia sp. OPL2 TaxID=2486274 RepID=UPI00292A486D|nr:DUF4328 domain-containing protein [Gordonia sp. OPL2]